MNRIIPTFLAVLATGVCAPWAQAGRTICSIYFHAPPDAPDRVFLQGQKEKGEKEKGEKEIVEVAVNSAQLSPRVELPPGDHVFRCLLKPSADGEKVPASAPTVRISKGWTDVILLFAANPENKEYPFLVTALDASPAKFGPGELLCFNRTADIIGGVLGERKFKVGPGKSLLIKSPAKGLTYPVMVNYIPAGETKAKRLVRSTWRHDPTVRRLMFIVRDEARLVPRICSIADYSNPMRARKENE